MTDEKPAPEGGYDYSDFELTPEEKGGNSMAQLAALAREQLDCEARVATCEAQLEEAMEALNNVRRKRLPKILDDLELEKFTTANGLEISVGESLQGSIPKATENEAHQFLLDNDQGEMIKRQIVIDFGLKEESWAKKFLADCKRRKKQLNMKVKRTVPAPTLKAYIRGALAEGVAVPMDVFGVVRVRESKVKVKK